MRSPSQIRLLQLCLCILVIVILGSAGYVWLEGWSLLDSYFMTVITLTTVGYSETQPLTPSGRLYTSILIGACVVGMTCWSAALTSLLVESDLEGKYARKRNLRMISRLAGHTVVCGSNRLAVAVIERMLARNCQVVLIDNHREQLGTLKEQFPKLFVIEGNPTDETMLARGGVLKAAYLVAALDDEMHNLLVAITCKELRPGLPVFAHAHDATIANRMRKAGVDHIISPADLCGEFVAQQIGAASN